MSSQDANDDDNRPAAKIRPLPFPSSISVALSNVAAEPSVGPIKDPGLRISTNHENHPERVHIMVTLDGSSYSALNIGGLNTPEQVKDLIFTKLNISEEQQSQHSIYLTRVGYRATSEALSSEEVLNEATRPKGEMAYFFVAPSGRLSPTSALSTVSSGGSRFEEQLSPTPSSGSGRLPSSAGERLASRPSVDSLDSWEGDTSRPRQPSSQLRFKRRPLPTPPLSASSHRTSPKLNIEPAFPSAPLNAGFDLGDTSSIAVQFDVPETPTLDEGSVDSEKSGQNTPTPVSLPVSDSEADADTEKSDIPPPPPEKEVHLLTSRPSLPQMERSSEVNKPEILRKFSSPTSSSPPPNKLFGHSPKSARGFLPPQRGQSIEGWSWAQTANAFRNKFSRSSPSIAETTVDPVDSSGRSHSPSLGSSADSSDVATIVATSSHGSTLVNQDENKPIEFNDNIPLLPAFNFGDPDMFGGSPEYNADEDDYEDEDDGPGTLWASPPVSQGDAKKSPPESVGVDTAPVSPGSAVSPLRRQRRVSRFMDHSKSTWAPRPSAEDVYDQLEEFFPGHNLDVLVENPELPAATVPSDVDNPAVTAIKHTGTPIPPIPPIPDEPNRSRLVARRSIRVAAKERKERLNRVSSVAQNKGGAALRRRSTKLWGNTTKELTPGQEAARVQNVNKTPPMQVPRKVVQFEWIRGELIGKGTYGRVYLAMNVTTGEMLAVKQVEIPTTEADKFDARQSIFVDALRLEINTLQDLDHENIVQYLGFEQNPTHLSIFLEYVPGGSVGSSLQKHGRFDESVVKSFTRQILRGLEYLHSKHIIHRDLKADNILVETNGTCKITDFGISKQDDQLNGNGQNVGTSMQGTVFWMAPEVINVPADGYNNKIDIWSIGCVVHEMWTSKRPWFPEVMLTVMLKVGMQKQPPPLPDLDTRSQDAQDFHDACFKGDPSQRPTATELQSHPYLELGSDWMFRGFEYYDN